MAASNDQHVRSPDTEPILTPPGTFRWSTECDHVRQSISLQTNSKKCFFPFRKHVQCNLPAPVTTNTTQAFIHWIYLTQINQAVTYKSISDVCRVHSSVEMIDPKTSQGYLRT